MCVLLCVQKTSTHQWVVTPSFRMLLTVSWAYVTQRGSPGRCVLRFMLQASLTAPLISRIPPSFANRPWNRVYQLVDSIPWPAIDEYSRGHRVRLITRQSIVVVGRFVYLYCSLDWDDLYTSCGGLQAARPDCFTRYQFSMSMNLEIRRPQCCVICAQFTLRVNTRSSAIAEWLRDSSCQL